MKKLKDVAIQILSVTIIMVIMLSISVSGMTVVKAAENYNGGWAFNKSNGTAVYSSSNGTTVIGSIGREGITVLSVSGTTYYIEYSTSSGAKRGYIINPSLDTSMISNTCVAKVNYNSTTYYGPNTSTYVIAGSVGAGEYVSVLAKEGSWVYVEYNTTSGRKRGYMLYANLSCYNRPQYFPDFYMTNGQEGTVYATSIKSIYAGPNDSSYAYVGYIDSSDGACPLYYSYLYGNGEAFHYIEYYTSSGKKKSGFIRWDVY